jgi:hypothetical protein
MRLISQILLENSVAASSSTLTQVYLILKLTATLPYRSPSSTSEKPSEYDVQIMETAITTLLRIQFFQGQEESIVDERGTRVT